MRTLGARSFFSLFSFSFWLMRSHNKRVYIRLESANYKCAHTYARWLYIMTRKSVGAPFYHFDYTAQKTHKRYQMDLTLASLHATTYECSAMRVRRNKWDTRISCCSFICILLSTFFHCFLAVLTEH